MTACAWTLRDGTLCRSLAQVEGFCPAHLGMRQELEAEDAERAARGEPPMTDKERERLLKRLSRARKAARRSAVQKFA